MKTRLEANESLVMAYEKGYRVTVEGDVIGLKGYKLKLMSSNVGYYFFHMKYKGKNYAIPVHRLHAYQKFGNELLKEGVIVRHLDDDRSNNTFENIAIGDWYDNYGDMSNDTKRRMLTNAINTRKFTESDIRDVRTMLKEGLTIRSLADKYEVHPGTIQQIKEGRTYRWVK